MYHLENMKTGTYRIQVQKEHIQFDEISVKITPNTPQIQDIIASGSVSKRVFGFLINFSHIPPHYFPAIFLIGEVKGKKRMGKMENLLYRHFVNDPLPPNYNCIILNLVWFLFDITFRYMSYFSVVEMHINLILFSQVWHVWANHHWEAPRLCSEVSQETGHLLPSGEGLGRWVHHNWQREQILYQGQTWKICGQGQLHV